MLRGLDMLLAQECEVAVHSTERPLETVVDRRGPHARAPGRLPDGVPARATEVSGAMTFSIVAADMDNGDWGIAVASKFPCVGAVVPWARAGVGAVATQSWANTSFGPEGLALMGAGVEARAALDRLLAGDDGREDRQVGFVDASGRRRRSRAPSAWTGPAGSRATGSPRRATSWRGRPWWPSSRARSSRPKATCATACWPRSWPATQRAATNAAGNPPRCWSCARAEATRGATTATSTCASTTTRIPSMSWSGSSACGTSRCWCATTRCWTRRRSSSPDLQRRLAALGRYDGRRHRRLRRRHARRARRLGGGVQPGGAPPRRRPDLAAARAGDPRHHARARRLSRIARDGYEA